MHKATAKLTNRSQRLLRLEVAWNFREVINLLALSFQAQGTVHRISFVIYEQAKEFISQSEDSFAELTPAPSDPEKS